MKEERFSFSGLPKHIEFYKCYDDPALDVWIDGMELWENKEKWKLFQKKRWNFFYRPIKSRVGAPQKNMIVERLLINRAYREKIKYVEIASAVVGSLGGVILLFAILQSMAVPMLVAALLSEALTLGCLARRGYLKGEVRRNEHEIETLRHEIEELITQIPPLPSTEDIENDIRDDLVRMERKCLGEIINSAVDEKSIEEVIRHEQICPPLRGLLVQGWGLLQPIQVHGPFGRESTGVRRVCKDIRTGLATWRSSSGNMPIYRVRYLQYIFLLDKNINVYSFFYDCVTRKQYGCRSESFQYNHVTNFSIREVEVEENDVIHSILPASFLSKIVGEEIKVFALAVASGSHFRCVLIDEAVIRSMNEWLELEENWERIEASEVDRERLLRTFDNDVSLVDEFLGEERERRSETRKILAKQRTRLEGEGTHLAQKALQQIRLRVESYAEHDWDTGSREVA